MGGHGEFSQEAGEVQPEGCRKVKVEAGILGGWGDLNRLRVEAVEEIGGESQAVIPSTGECHCPGRRYVGPL